jgi:uncharacterized protein YtpQ (UPF0354 family)
MDTRNGNSRTSGNGAAPVMMPEQFAAYIEKRLDLVDEIEVLGHDGLELRLRVRGADMTADLGNFYHAYTRDPSQLDVVVQNFVEVMLGITPDRSTSDFDALAARIYPMLKPIELLAAVRERGLPMLAYREFLADLIITYVIDEERSVTFINEDHLERWGIGMQELHAQALENLRDRTLERIDYTSTGAGVQRIFIFNSGDGYDATRLLLADVLAGWAREVPGRLVIGIPNRDFLIAFSDADPAILQGVAHQIQADSVQRAYGLTDQLFTLIDGEIREYVWD